MCWTPKPDPKCIQVPWPAKYRCLFCALVEAWALWFMISHPFWAPFAIFWHKVYLSSQIQGLRTCRTSSKQQIVAESRYPRITKWYNKNSYFGGPGLAGTLLAKFSILQILKLLLAQIAQYKAPCPNNRCHSDYSNILCQFEYVSGLNAKTFGGQISIKSMLHARNSLWGKLMCCLIENTIFWILRTKEPC